MKPRYLPEVIERILDRIPRTEIAFREKLNSELQDNIFRAPEDTFDWGHIADVIEKHIYSPSQDWEWEVLSIFTTRKIQELQTTFKNS